MRRSAVVLVGFGLVTAACAKQQASEPAAAEASEPESQKKEALPSDEAQQPQSGAVPAPPGAAPRAPEAERDVLSERSKEYPTTIAQSMAELQGAFSDMNRALVMLSAPDCITGARLRDKVCDLAEHICRLADESGDASSQQLCGDGRARCREARQRYTQTCSEP